MESILNIITVIFFIICCILGFFEMDAKYINGYSYWQSRYDFMYELLEPLGWVLTILAIIGWPGILLGFIKAKNKQNKHDREIIKEEEIKEEQHKAEYNKIKNSSMVYEIADAMRKNGMICQYLKYSGVAVDKYKDSKLIYSFSDKGLPYLGKSQLEGLRDGLLSILGDEWHGGSFIHGDSDYGLYEDDYIIMRFEPKKKEYVPTRSW